MDLPRQLPAPARRRPIAIHGAILAFFLAVDSGRAGPIVLAGQAITLPANASAPLFADVDGDGRADLLVIDTVEKRLWNFHQRAAGFTNSPDQAIALPPQTAWVTLCDVEAHPGLELLASTATGLVYLRQNDGLFELEWRTLIQANQVFTNSDFPRLTLLSTNRTGTNDLIPVISAGQAVLYHRTDTHEWTPEPPVTLDKKQNAWHVNLDPNPWSLGPNPAHSLRARQSFRAKPVPTPDATPENETIRLIIDNMKQRDGAGLPQIEAVDVDGDGREDLVLWQGTFKLDFKTDIYIFLRGADQKLPEKPTQVLHCRGFPISGGSLEKWSPLQDLDADGVCEMVLLEPKIAFTSPAAWLEVALARGVDWLLTIRTFHNGAFSGSPQASVPVKTILQLEDFSQWSVCIRGDFNGDGRPDLLVRRAETQWNIYCSTTDGRWFAPQPALTLDAPARGYFEIEDLNGDGLADIVRHEWDEPRLAIFMTPAAPAKANHR